jgi:antitoxin VapB
MAMNIKNPEAERLAREVAQLNGETITTAIVVALKERLERQQWEIERAGRMEWLKRISAETAAIMNDGRTSKELMDELYDDETGLPK